MTSVPSRLDSARTGAYLARLGLARAAVAIDLAGLTLLHERHLRSIPFENLSIHLGEPIELDADALVDKLTVRCRGGFCYELNGAFASLLATLGFDVALYEARVGPAGAGMRFDHMCLRVRIDGRDHLADVGFGASFLRPLDLQTRAPQRDPAGSFRIAPVGSGVPGEFDMIEDDEIRYRFSTVPRALHDFAGGCLHHTTSPSSHFTQSTTCSIATPSGRVTLSGRTLIVTEHGHRTRRIVDSDDDLLELYRRHFGIVLTRLPSSALRRSS